MTATGDPVSVAALVTQTLDSLGIAHTIGGSIASSFAGEPRSTIDIDIVVALTEAHIRPLVAALEGDFYINETALRRAVRDRSSANLIHQASYLKVDLFVAGGTALDEQQLRRRREVRLSDGRTLHVHPPEDILLQKLHWYRKGGEVSDRQWRDIRGIVRVQGAALDRTYLAENAHILAVSDLLERALREESGAP
jgi:hypothetical protein